MAVLYSSAEIAAIGRAGAVCARILSEAAGAARAGVSGLEIDALARRRLSEAGAESVLAEQVGPSGTFRGAISVSTGRTVANGTPAARAFAPGELVRLDLAVRLDGWVCDAATTVAAGEPSPEAQRVLAGAQVALDATIASMSPGVRWSEAVRAGRAAAAAAGVHVADWPWGTGSVAGCTSRRFWRPTARRLPRISSCGGGWCWRWSRSCWGRRRRWRAVGTGGQSWRLAVGRPWRRARSGPWRSWRRRWRF